MIRAVLIAVLSGFAFTACAILPDREGAGEVVTPQIDPAKVVEGEEDVRCPAEQYQVLVGQPREEIHYDSLPYPHRVYGENDLVTQDYAPDRMNVVVGMNGRVVEVTCG